MRIRHIAYVVSELDRSAAFYEQAFGFKRIGDRTPGSFPGPAIDLSDGQVQLSLMSPSDGQPDRWSAVGLGPLHIGVVVDDITASARVCDDWGLEIYTKHGDPMTFFKVKDFDGVEIDVAGRDDTWDF